MREGGEDGGWEGMEYTGPEDTRGEKFDNLNVSAQERDTRVNSLYP